MTTGSWSLTGATQAVGVIGDPIRHSLSPLIHNAAFRAMDLDMATIAFEVPAGRGIAALDAVRALNIRGLSVTMPHKAEIVPALDALAPSAAALGVVNCVVNDDGVLTGHNTDGDGFVQSCRHEMDFDPAGRSCLIIGAGGAARSIAEALGRCGAARVGIANRTEAKALECVALAGASGALAATGEAPDYDLVINATSVGMGDGAMPLDASALRPEHVVIDIVYNPLVTPLVAAASDIGARTANGVDMLVYQAAVAIGLWTGREVPVAPMIDAANAAVGGPSGD